MAISIILIIFNIAFLFISTYTHNITNMIIATLAIVAFVGLYLLFEGRKRKRK